jgi:hypothetical protein
MRFRGLIAVMLLTGAGAAAPALAQTDNDAAWRILRDTGTVEQLRRFIAESPDGPQRREAEERLKTLEPPRGHASKPPAWLPDKPPAAVKTAPIPPSAGVRGPPVCFDSCTDDAPRPPGGNGNSEARPPGGSRHGVRLAAAPQPAVLYEEDAFDPNGLRFTGTAVWRIERDEDSAGSKLSVTIRADVEIPERNLSVHLSIRRNGDPSLLASHTVEIRFTLLPGFRHGGIASVPGIMVKQGETNRGTALNGVAVKVTANYFMVGLAAEDAGMTRNVQLLKERSWFDIPLVYSDGQRAIIAIGKGGPGARVFAEAFAAWDREDHAGAIETPSPKPDKDPGAPVVEPPAVEQAGPGEPPGITGKPPEDPEHGVMPAPAPQRAVLYEEDPAAPDGTTFAGTAVWHLERTAASAGLQPAVSIVADIDIPERSLSVHLSIRRNDNSWLRASHTVRLAFTAPPGLPHDGITSVPGLLMKASETASGTALYGVAAKVTGNYFKVDLSAEEGHMQNNIRLLKERSWLDIPVVYSDGKRAIIAVEKGAPGASAFAEALAAWEQEAHAGR